MKNKLERRKTGGPSSTNQKSLFMGNLHKEWSVDEFEEMVREVLEDVEHVDLAIQPGQHQNRGFGFVKFSSHAAAAQAYKLGSQPDFLLGGKWHPTVEWAEEELKVYPEELAKVKVAFLRDLPTDVNEDHIKKLFEPYGKLEKIVLSKKTNGQVGFVHFIKRSDLDNAIKHLNDKTIQGFNAALSFKLQVEVGRPFEKNRKRIRDEYGKHSPKDSSVSKIPKGERPLSLSNSCASKVLEEPIAIDLYEATVISLPDPVKDRLLRILRLGIATRYDIDLQSLIQLKELPETTSISILNQFMLMAADEIDRGAFLAALIAKHGKTSVLHQVQLSAPHKLTRLVDVVSLGSDLPRLSERNQMPVESSGHVITALKRYDSYAYAHTPDHVVSPQPGIPKTEKLALPLHQPPVLLPSYRRSGINSPHEASSSHSTINRYESYPPHLVSWDRSISPLQTGIQIVDKPTLPMDQLPVPLQSYRRVVIDSPPRASHAQPRQLQMRFDPVTGEPYKFDPFTGEPIQPLPPYHSSGGRYIT